jgi:predicted AlkP superfamily pyrophosphatase or phosphodiesterase
MRHLHRLLIVCLCVASSLLSFSPAVAADSPARTRQPHRVVVMVSVDGLAGFYLDDPKADMPNIRALAKQGARAESMIPVAPTVTWPNHTTLVTGDTPALHGVVGNNYYDRSSGENVTLIWDPLYNKDQIVKVPTIYDLAKEAGLTTAAIRWPASRGAKTLDWTTPDVVQESIFARYVTPSLLAECRQAKIGIDGSRNGGPAPDHIYNDGDQDEQNTHAFNLILRQHKPDLALIHLLNVDHTEHANGPRTPLAYAAIKLADQQVGEIWSELKRDFPDRSTLVVVSDHGFSPIDHAILPNVVLRQNGLVQVKGKKIVGGSVHILPQGGAALVYIKDPANRDTIIAKVKKAFTGLKGIDKVVAGRQQLAHYGVGDASVDPHAPDMVLFAQEGWSFGDTAAGALPFVDKPERRGTHGHCPDIPDLHATFVAWGAGIKPGSRTADIPNIDVAPTLANLLGIQMPNVQGHPIQAILAQ